MTGTTLFQEDFGSLEQTFACERSNIETSIGSSEDYGKSRVDKIKTMPRLESVCVCDVKSETEVPTDARTRHTQ